MPALETSVNLEVKQIQSQEETWKTQLVNGGATDVSLNSLHRLNGSDDASAIKPGRLVEAQAEATVAPASNGEKVVSNGQSTVTSLRPESQAVQNNNSLTLTPSSCNAPVIVSKTPISAALSLSTPKTAVAPFAMNAHIINGSTNVQSAVSNPVPKIIMNAGQSGTNSPVVPANNVVQGNSSVTRVGQPTVTASTCGQVKVDMSLAPTSQAVVSTMTAPQASKVTRVATITQTPGKGTVIALPRPSTPQPTGAPRAPQTTSVQLPANFQIPQGMVLIRSDSGQLMLVSQQALAQAQAQGIIPRVNAAARAPPTPAAGQATTIVRNSEVTPVIKVPPPPASGTPVTSFQKMSVLKVTGSAVSAAAGPTVRPAVPATATVTPATAEGPKATPTAAISAETLENVKKCKNFLVTLIKLASSGTHSVEMAKNVKELVKSLLDGKIEAEEFTDRLYTELKSSPQPYLVPFLKRSLPAVRQLTPNSQLFIQQCAVPKPPPAPQQGARAAPPAPAGHSKPSQPSLATAPAPRPAQPPSSTHLVIQHPRGVVIKQALTSAPPRVVSLPRAGPDPGEAVCHRRDAVGFPRHRNLHEPFLRSGVENHNHAPVCGPEKQLQGRNPRVFQGRGRHQRRGLHGRGEPERGERPYPSDQFGAGGLGHTVLPRRALHPRGRPAAAAAGDRQEARRHGRERGRRRPARSRHAAASEGASGKADSGGAASEDFLQDDVRHRQTSDTRAQLKFLEQLDRLEKERKDGEEREILLRIAKSRSNREDPEQLRLKQKAKEMQQLELAQMQQREANLTALAAIGPRKKRPLDSRGNEVTGALGSSPAVVKQGSVLRVTRVGLRDLLFCMEQDPTLRHTLSLYRALLR
ncbi:hypothetical protein ANANG_G00076490 [Anguilla anguilla]|uniref:TAFH domain-containing protein n=1 Tax=Anguilla anguilla TaxID=7936 RepID=A0A9D3MJJ8_ANGAN|nr:hypothetical protein ANANG_G00076490 [Anguilla anguilla]